MTRVNRKSEESNPMSVLRDDLVVLKSGDSDGSMYSIQDPSTGSIYEFGPEEWFLLKQMDGSVNFEEAAKRFKVEFKQDASRDQIETLVKMATRWGLFKGSLANRPKIVDLAESAPESVGRAVLKEPEDERGRLGGTGKKPLSKKRSWKRYALPVTLLIVALAPYPYETGGQFIILPQLRQDIYAEIEGAVDKVFFKGGETVAAGTLLAQQVSSEERKNLLTTEAEILEQRARLDELLNSPTPEELTLAEQKLDTARTAAKFARESEERFRPLSISGDISLEDYEDARRKAEVSRMEELEAEANLAKVKAGPHPQEVEAARFELERLNEQLKYYQERMGMTRLVMPFDGRIVTRNLDFSAGAYLHEGDLFAVVESDQTVIVEVEISETDISDIAIGARVKVKVWAYPGQTFIGAVTEIAPVVEHERDDNVNVVTTEVPNPDGALRSGMTGFAKVDGGNKPVIVAFTRVFVRFFWIEIWSWLP